MNEAAFGIAAGIVGILAIVPYVLGTVSRKTIPNRATWIIWAVLGVIIATSYYSAGARDTAWTPIAYAIGLTIVAILSIRYGEGGLAPFDIACLAAAGIGLALWAFTSDPTLALYLTITIDAIGALPTIKKAYERPKTEDATAWMLFLVANTLNLLAIGEWTLAIVSYPVYVFVLSVMMNILILFPGNRKHG